jgi:hypothetical protein
MVGGDAVKPRQQQCLYFDVAATEEETAKWQKITIVSLGINFRLYIHLPHSQNNYVVIILIGKLYCKPCPMHECLAGKCEAQLGPIICPG